MRLSIDIETYSSVDLAKTGVYAYADAPDFALLLFAYAFDDEPIKCVDIASGEMLPERVLKALTDKGITKSAYNAQFERVCIGKYLGKVLPPDQWHCSRVHAAELGLPQNLADTAKVLGLNAQKDPRGKALIRYFSKPVPQMRSTSQICLLSEEGSRRRMPESAPDKWAVFKAYCIQDVEVEREITKKLDKFPMRKQEQELYILDQKINDRGIRLDTDMTKNAAGYFDEFTRQGLAKMKQLTGLDNPNSIAQLKRWVNAETGVLPESLDKTAVADMLESDAVPLKVKAILKLRAELSKTSVKKYETMQKSICGDGRIHGALQFYGAGRTGRWAGRIIQPQNLPQNHLKDLDAARSMVQLGDYELFSALYGNVPQVLSELIRTALIPKDGCRFIVADFSAIEARVLAYLADENWRLETFRNNGDIYCASASRMFHVPVVKHGINGHLRQKGKIAELALGYGGGVGAMKAMGALRMGIEEDDLADIVQTWRIANSNIQKFWLNAEEAALKALEGSPSFLGHNIAFYTRAGILFVGLPSGRSIAYLMPRVKKNKFGRSALHYLSANAGQMRETETFGGKLTENIVQAVARDCLAEALLRLDKLGYGICFHVHDEIIAEMPLGVSSADEMAAAMCRELPWAPGLPLNADGYECDYYRKD